MTQETLKLALEFNKRFTSMNGVDVPERVSVPRDEWRALLAALSEALAQPAVPLTDEKIAEIVQANLHLQINVAGIRSAIEATQALKQMTPTNCRHCGGPENVLCAGQCKQAAHGITEKGAS